MDSEAKYSDFIVPQYENYCSPGLNEIKFIGERQTISLVLGSCISTVLIGRGSKYILAANHIVIADPHEGSRIATKSARQQIEEMIQVFHEHYNIEADNLICFHLIGGGNKREENLFHINERNANISKEILNEKEITNIFKDTGSYFVSKYSIQKNNLSVFIENKFTGEHVSFIIDLNALFNMDKGNFDYFPVSSLTSSSQFENMVDDDIITFITGKRNR